METKEEEIQDNPTLMETVKQLVTSIDATDKLSIVSENKLICDLLASETNLFNNIIIQGNLSTQDLSKLKEGLEKIDSKNVICEVTSKP